jgi:dolichyl-phosphate beta-glucosyltransferase
LGLISSPSPGMQPAEPTRPAIVRPVVANGKDRRTVSSLVFPTFDPGPAIDRTWAAVREFLADRFDAWEVLFVCDGCSDGTADRLAALARRLPDPRIRVLSYPTNRGKGYAVRYGLAAARGAYRVFTDVDLAYRFEDVVRVADELKHGAGLAVASRDHPESLIQVPVRFLGYAYRRRIQSRLFGAAARVLLPVGLTDTQAGLKGMTADVARRVLPRLRCDGFGFDCELLTACARLGVAVTPVPVCVRYEDAASTTGPGSTVRMVRELWQIRRAWRGSGPPADPAVVVAPVLYGRPVAA